MLKLLRKKKVAKRIYYVLAALIIPAFVIWGSASVMNKSKAPDYAGVLFGKKVSYEDFQNAMTAWKTQLKLQYGEKAEEAASTIFNPVQATWDRLTMLEEVRRRKIKVDDAETIKALTELPFLQRNGKFDPQTYELFLKYFIGLAPRIFEEHLRQNLAMAEIFKQETKGTAVSDEEVKAAYEKQNVQTRVAYIAFSPDAYKENVTVTDQEVQAYFEKSKETFKVPPQVDTVYAGVEYKEGATEEEKEAVKEKIKQLGNLARTKGLVAAAKELTIEIKETGYFGLDDPIPTLGWLPQLSNLLFDTETGSLSQIIQTSRGLFIFEIKDKKESYVPSFEEAKLKVKEALTNEKAKEIAKKKAEDLLVKIKNNKLSLEKAAEEAKLPVKETPLFSRESYVAELGMAQNLKDAAFKLEKGAIADEIVSLDQGFYIIQSLESPKLDEEKFGQEKEPFSKQLLEEKRNQTFNTFFETLRNKAHLVSYIDQASIPRQ
jgi:peptidyl-prolyl cis-trans isomerase D